MLKLSALAQVNLRAGTSCPNIDVPYQPATLDLPARDTRALLKPAIKHTV